MILLDPKTLFLICPMDFLESTIIRSFRGEKFFCTCLGNQHCLVNGTVSDIQSMIDFYKINKILFVARIDNDYIKHIVNTEKVLIDPLFDRSAIINSSSSDSNTSFEIYEMQNYLLKQATLLGKELKPAYNGLLGAMVIDNIGFRVMESYISHPFAHLN